MSAAAVGTHSLSLMSCVRESSPLQEFEQDNEKVATSKKKFWNLKKWFRRKRTAEDIVTVDVVDKEAIRSRSTSELSVSEEQTRRKSGSSSIIHPGLSVSHDSVFHSPNSCSDVELEAAQSSSSLSISQPQIDLRLQTELSERLRLRRGRGTGDTSEDDEGLPHSPCNSPTTTDVFLDKTGLKDLPTKSHSTCSDGSLLSMGSSDIEEESITNQQSCQSSKLSLHEEDSEFELSPSSSTSPLNHSAAHHRVAVRPKRRAPHRIKRVPPITTALPITLEVNEEASVRSITPESISIPREAVTELFSISTTSSALLTETQLKCSSLPPGLVAPDGETNKLNRSHSNVGSKSQEHFTAPEEITEEKTDKTFFDRIFPRRSAKKRKSKEEIRTSVSAVNSTTIQQTTKYESKPSSRSGAAARQRIQPIDLPPSPGPVKKDSNVATSPSPLQVELQTRFTHRKTSDASPTPPQSPKSPKISDDKTVISKVEQIQYSSKFNYRESKNEEIRSKIKIPGLSSLQQRALSLNDETDDNFNSLSAETCGDSAEIKYSKPVTKSHSFKTSKLESQFVVNNDELSEKRILLSKASSLDSVKHLETPVEHTSDKLLATEEATIKEVFGDNITISGPCHTAVVNVSTNNQQDSYNSNTKIEKVTTEEGTKEVTSRESVSITKIHMKREATHVTKSTVTVPKQSVPEFLNRQLNKVDISTARNVVLAMNSSRTEDQSRTSNIFNFTEQEPVSPRKFSTEDLEIVEKIVETTPPANQNRFKKNEKTRKSSTNSNTPDSPSREYTRSFSNDSLKSSDKSSQDSLDKLDEISDSSDKKERRPSAVETVVLRKKSLVKQKNDEEPELMKVFARRSMKLKDAEAESVSQQVNDMLLENEADLKSKGESDKENHHEMDSLVDECRKSADHREPLVETKIVELIEAPQRKESVDQTQYVETAEVTLRKKSVDNNTFRNNEWAVSEIAATNKEDDWAKVKKQQSFSDRRKTDNNWISSNIRNKEDVVVVEGKISQVEIITKSSRKSDFFNQRKAEWEKRAQEAQKKTVP